MRPSSPVPAALVLAAALSACQPAPAPASAAEAPAQEVSSDQGDANLTVVARGLSHPWAVAPLPDGSFLVTERGGALRRVSADGSVSAPLAGVPEVSARGQGGLLDVALAPDFAQSRRIYLSYAEPGDGGLSGTAAAYATLGDDGLTDVSVIYRQEPKVNTENHYGSRFAFDDQGHVFISQGERTLRAMSQELDKLQGKLVRLHLDGSVPKDNPFVGRQDARPEIWSYGHRNSQGLAFDPRTGKLWESEHGPRGGDEINLPRPGLNYGWPVVTHGIDYSGQPIPEAVGKERAGMEPAHFVFEVSPGLSGMAFYTGRPGKPWNDSLFLGALAQRNLIRLQLEGDRVVAEERLLQDLGERIRDVRVAADGNLYLVTDEDDGKLLRLEPPQA
ncbi:oxidoreductase [Pseudoxanthomonas broegbernensis]|uniref:Oxidoreductase n=1 Tax=Pseudoxanthomonas broegbernensis TaxID=83619 RepID=A0A7V8GPR9_9GAMM|nr:PQQ-dependent sugar dehydrogenase [Pseudoxanthomonas broegbernensis]KAF1687940.1 oxidoreductase [Pseudoxanthomonas broegbernensis]MBB6064946.1 glucose/arabinose dehydrogenase [Pseudoxanthomonas broegbernensis]